jgi:hypothetical protein
MLLAVGRLIRWLRPILDGGPQPLQQFS